MTAIRAIGTYLPERTIGNDELIERFEWDREFLEDKLGIHQRHIAAEGEGAADMGVAAAEDRVMWFLDWVASDQKVCCTGGTVWLPMNRQDIADFLHLAPETLSRALSRLVRRSAIRVLEGHRIQLRPGSAVRPEPGRPTACASRLISPSSRDGVEASVK